MWMEGRERIVFFGTEGFGGERNTPSSTPSPVSTPSPPHAGGMAGVGGKVGCFIGDGGSSGGVAAAEGMGMRLGMMESSEEMMRKKGESRPKKYGPEDMALGLNPAASPPFSAAGDFSGKRSRGRPRGSGRCQLLATLGEWFQLSAGGSFTPHVVSIAAGEDLAARILSFSQRGPRAVCILSANGAISNVTLRQPGSSGGTLTYEGRFEILSLSGSFTITDFDGVRSRTGGLSVSLAGPDGRVVGGGVAGLLLAASPIQVVVGSFLPNTLKEHKRKQISDPSSFPHMLPSPSHATQEEEQCEHVKSAPHGPMIGSNLPNSMINGSDLNPPSFRSVHWQGLQPLSEHKSSPDINLRLQGE